MFDSLTQKLQSAFKNLARAWKGFGRECRRIAPRGAPGLLDADVNFKVARDFIERVKTKAIGQEVIQSIQPGQQIIKIIHDELVECSVSSNISLQLSGNPACVLMAGLQWLRKNNFQRQAGAIASQTSANPFAGGGRRLSARGHGSARTLGGKSKFLCSSKGVKRMF